MVELNFKNQFFSSDNIRRVKRKAVYIYLRYTDIHIHTKYITKDSYVKYTKIPTNKKITDNPIKKAMT